MAYQQSVWNTGTLSSGPHTVKIWRDPSSLTGKYISVDAVEVIGTLTQATVQPPTATGATRYQQTDSDLAYQGSWSTLSTASASGGSYKRANSNGSSVTVTFNGTYLAWIATKGTTLGKAFVSLDGRAPVGVNLAASVVAYQQSVWNTGTLSSGPHTVKIWRDPSSVTGKYISVDAVEVIGNLVDPPPTIYYVDATNGSDSNDGTSTATPLEALSKVRKSVTANNPYPAGTRILLKRGETWREPLRFYTNSTAGTVSKPVLSALTAPGPSPSSWGVSMEFGQQLDRDFAGSHIWWTTAGTKDIGNVVFNNGTSIGQKHFNSTAILTPRVPLTDQGDFYFNGEGASYYGSTAIRLYMYSMGNPALSTTLSSAARGR